MKSKGFTMVNDSIVLKHGAFAGLIYGKIARYCEWSGLGICNASNARLAGELSIGESTIRKYKKILKDAGYIRVVGKNGDTNTVTIVGDTVLESRDPLLNSEDPATKKLGGSLLDSDKESMCKKEIPQKGDLLDFYAKYQSKEPDVLDFSWMPVDVEAYLKSFAIRFSHDFKREATKSERGYWIREAREWFTRGYSPADVMSAYNLCQEREITISSPKSITWAFDQLGKVTEEEHSSREM